MSTCDGNQLNNLDRSLFHLPICWRCARNPKKLGSVYCFLPSAKSVRVKSFLTQQASPLRYLRSSNALLCSMFEVEHDQTSYASLPPIRSSLPTKPLFPPKLSCCIATTTSPSHHYLNNNFDRCIQSSILSQGFWPYLHSIPNHSSALGISVMRTQISVSA